MWPCGLAIFLLAQANNPPPPALDSWGQPPELTEMVGRTLLATGIVLALAIVALFGLRWFIKPVPDHATTDPNLLSLRARMRVGPRSWLLLVRAGTQEVLVAVDHDGIRHVTVLPLNFDEETPGEAAEPERQS